MPKRGGAEAARIPLRGTVVGEIIRLAFFKTRSDAAIVAQLILSKSFGAGGIANGQAAIERYLRYSWKLKGGHVVGNTTVTPCRFHNANRH